MSSLKFITISTLPTGALFSRFPLVPFPVFVFSPVSLKLLLLRNPLSSLRWWQKSKILIPLVPALSSPIQLPPKFCVPRTLPWLHLQTLLFPHMHPTLFAHSFSICISLLSDSSLSLGDKSARLELLCKEGSFAICHHMGPKAKSSAKRLNQVCRTKCYELTLWVYNFMPFVAICLSKQPPFHTNTQKSLPCSQGFSTGVTVPPFSFLCPLFCPSNLCPFTFTRDLILESGQTPIFHSTPAEIQRKKTKPNQKNKTEQPQ